jgi:uncharacterized protein (TIGR00266 family)
MDVRIEGKPVFGHLRVTLQPGETLTTESGAMASMGSGLDLKAKFNGGFFRGLARKFIGGESLFLSDFTNNTVSPQDLVLTTAVPGDIREYDVSTGPIRMQPGAYIACEPTVKMELEWAGIAALLAREGLFRLRFSGTGRVWFGAYGLMIDRDVVDELVVDTGFLVAYPPGMTLKTGLSGGLISSLTSGEGLITRVRGRGRIVLQTRDLGSLARWLNHKL